jgi:hypothetical protein
VIGLIIQTWSDIKIPMIILSTIIPQKTCLLGIKAMIYREKILALHKQKLKG